MWQDLKKEKRNRYKTLITNFSSLSEAFAQKEEDDDSIVAPIVNSKFQETAFQKCFDAFAEDIANTSYDASINNGDHKYLVGIKTFGLNSGDQKIAQFKSIAGSSKWAELINDMKQNAVGLKTKKDIDKANHDLYLALAKKIATVRNERIKSSKENLRGFEVTDSQVEAVYHVLMPSSKNEQPTISVGETSYKSIDIDNIQILGCTTPKNPQNFNFTDGIHEYKWTATDSQLSMKFHNKDIVLEKWPVHYVDDAFSFFENMGKQAVEKEESYSWLLEIEPYSGFNAFMGQSKMARKNNYREKRIAKIIKKYQDQLTADQVQTLSDYLNTLLLKNWKTTAEKDEMVSIRQNLIDYIKGLGNSKLLETIRSVVYRPSDELELRIPNSRQFHLKHPNFFTGTAIINSETKSCIGTKEERSFNLRFIPSKNVIKAYINQENGKAIESLGKQSTLGKWLLRDVFQLAPYEPLTQERLNEMNINAIRLTKRKDTIDLSFIWIDPDHKPKDFWE